MVFTHIVVRYGEIFLKGKNRNVFENQLLKNIKEITGLRKISNLRCRYVFPYVDNHADLRKVFGLVSYSNCVRVDKKLDLIKKAASDLLKDKIGSFRVEVKRADKTFPGNSPEIAMEIGQHIESTTKATFTYGSPEITLGVEINLDGAYLFLEKVPCRGGLPTGVEGKVILIVENKASILAGILFMKRGTSLIVAVTEDQDLSLLEKYNPSSLAVKRITNLSELEVLGKEEKINVLVSGQTFETYKEYSSEMIIFRPLISFSKERIEKEIAELSS
ncbi:MAG: THUMP domain-containing protein [archaeon]|nr:THUMP domain-containing protein [archaeon]